MGDACAAFTVTKSSVHLRLGPYTTEPMSCQSAKRERGGGGEQAALDVDGERNIFIYINIYK